MMDGKLYQPNTDIEMSKRIRYFQKRVIYNGT